jgi:hypothetical protein
MLRLMLLRLLRPFGGTGATLTLPAPDVCPEAVLHYFPTEAAVAFAPTEVVLHFAPTEAVLS